MKPIEREIDEIWDAAAMHLESIHAIFEALKDIMPSDKYRELARKLHEIANDCKYKYKQ